jgi:hypothetical protein
MRKIYMNVAEGDECRIAVLEDGRLYEFFIDRPSQLKHVGNIYKGIINNIEPGIQAAFVDIGLERNGFLHVSDVSYSYQDNPDLKDLFAKTLRIKEPLPEDTMLQQRSDHDVEQVDEFVGDGTQHAESANGAVEAEFLDKLDAEQPGHSITDSPLAVAPPVPVAQEALPTPTATHDAAPPAASEQPANSAAPTPLQAPAPQNGQQPGAPDGERRGRRRRRRRGGRNRDRGASQSGQFPAVPSAPPAAPAPQPTQEPTPSIPSRTERPGENTSRGPKLKQLVKHNHHRSRSSPKHPMHPTCWTCPSKPPTRRKRRRRPPRAKRRNLRLQKSAASASPRSAAGTCPSACWNRPSSRPPRHRATKARGHRRGVTTTTRDPSPGRSHAGTGRRCRSSKTCSSAGKKSFARSQKQARAGKAPGSARSSACPAATWY